MVAPIFWSRIIFADVVSRSMLEKSVNHVLLFLFLFGTEAKAVSVLNSFSELASAHLVGEACLAVMSTLSLDCGNTFVNLIDPCTVASLRLST